MKKKILFKLILFMLLISLYQCAIIVSRSLDLPAYQCRLPVKEFCMTAKCTDLMSKAKTQFLNVNSVDPYPMSFPANAEALECMKSAGSNPDLWYTSININSRFVISNFHREYKVLQKISELIVGIESPNTQPNVQPNEVQQAHEVFEGTTIFTTETVENVNQPESFTETPDQFNENKTNSFLIATPVTLPSQNYKPNTVVGSESSKEIANIVTSDENETKEIVLLVENSENLNEIKTEVDETIPKVSVSKLPQEDETKNVQSEIPELPIPQAVVSTPNTDSSAPLNVIGVPGDKGFSQNTLIKTEAAEPVEKNTSNVLTNNNENLKLSQQPIETNNVPGTSNVANLLKPEDEKTEHNLNKNSRQSVENVNGAIYGFQEPESSLPLAQESPSSLPIEVTTPAHEPTTVRTESIAASTTTEAPLDTTSITLEAELKEQILYLISIENKDRLIILLVIMGTSVLLFTLGYYNIENKRQKDEATINTIQRDLFVTSMERDILKEELTTIKTKLTSIEDSSFGLDDMVQSLKEENDELEAQNKQLRRSSDEKEELIRVLRNTIRELRNTLKEYSEEQFAELNGKISFVLVAFLFFFFFLYFLRSTN